MLSEIELDSYDGVLYQSARLNSVGKRMFPVLLRQAALEFNEEWLGLQLRENDCFNRMELVNGTERSVPRNAHELLSQGEFNRMYCRALCLRQIENGLGRLVIYRARESSRNRELSDAMIGKELEPIDFLEQLRSSIGVEVPMGLPPLVGSGLSVEYIEQ